MKTESEVGYVLELTKRGAKRKTHLYYLDAEENVTPCFNDAKIEPKKAAFEFTINYNFEPYNVWDYRFVKVERTTKEIKENK